MKTLMLLRHAKSSWKVTALADKDRPLTRRGRRDARKLGKRLAKRNVRIDAIVSSPAARARSTARRFAKRFGFKTKQIQIDDRLYGATARGLLAVIRNFDDKLRNVMLVGHNPELSVLAKRFAPATDSLSTCALAAFRLDCHSWSTIDDASLVDATLVEPK
jgi:phosphohistidine phosphatase